MWTRSAIKPNGTFDATVYTAEGNEVFAHEEGFATVRDAEKWAEMKQREMLFGAPAEIPTLDEIFAEMDDDELLAELGL